MSVCVCSCVSVYMYVWELTHVRRYRARICPCVTAARGEERGPQQQTTTQTVAGLSEVILSNGEQTTGHYHTDAASVQMWVLMKVHWVRNTINSFRAASGIMIRSLVQHSPDSLGITVILNESAMHDSCLLHSLEGNSDLGTNSWLTTSVATDLPNADLDTLWLGVLQKFGKHVCELNFSSSGFWSIA